MKPAIFNTEMVRAILDGRKTQTRRSIKIDLTANMDVDKNDKDYLYVEATDGEWYHLLTFAPYKAGDIIYVRETFNTFSDITMDKEIGVIYKADNEMARIPCEYNRPFEYATNGKWKPSIHMPKEYARLFLRDKDIRIERMNEISEEDAKAEGVEEIFFYEEPFFRDYRYSLKKLKVATVFPNAKKSFGSLWESIYGNGSFDNRYVWVIEFERISKEEAMSETAT